MIIPVIRRASVGDAKLLAQLGARTFHDTFAAQNTPENMAAYLADSFGTEIQAAELADPSVMFFIAEFDAGAIGYAQLRVTETPAGVLGMNPIELARIYVVRDWLGHGIGEALLRSCIEEARRAGHQTMWLGVWKRNTRAEAFYRKQKFRIVGEKAFQLGTEIQSDWVMERPLL